mmetsp:Transcript_40455/g.86851  ORF Transcript_40455/g.86851 Transcript_40455/m.86851 type:complete len:220 (+) Transcript_40455:87-746(+)
MLPWSSILLVLAAGCELAAASPWWDSSDSDAAAPDSDPAPSVTTFRCTVVASACSCAATDRCANSSVVKGVKNRGDAVDCCCSSNWTMLWSDPKAKCREAKKCVWECCPGGTKLCGQVCCDSSSKCSAGTCSKEATTTSVMHTSTPKPVLGTSWWEWLMWIVGVVILLLLGCWIAQCCKRNPNCRRACSRARHCWRAQRQLGDRVPQYRDMHVGLQDRP